MRVSRYRIQRLNDRSVFSIVGVMILNGFLHIGVLGMLISFAVGTCGVFVLVYSTALYCARRMRTARSLPRWLSAGVFNVFVATLNILLNVMGVGRRS